jgi:hypothetical protein
VSSPTRSTKDLKKYLKPLPGSIELIKTRDGHLPNHFREEWRDTNPRRPPSKYLITPQWIDIVGLCIILNHFTIAFKNTKKDRAPRIDTK